mgnify:CR=1 FL=1
MTRSEIGSRLALVLAPLLFTACGGDPGGCTMGPLCDDGSSTSDVSVATVEVTGSPTSFSFLGATVQL